MRYGRFSASHVTKNEHLSLRSLSFCSMPNKSVVNSGHVSVNISCRSSLFSCVSLMVSKIQQRYQVWIAFCKDLFGDVRANGFFSAYESQ